MSGPRRVLIVSPHFPPSSAPDMQRVRMSLPHFEEFGWRPCVLAVGPEPGEACDPLLLETVPPGIRVERVKAAPAWMCRPFGVGNIAARALPALLAAGSRLIESEAIDLVYFSTTMFFAMPLGRVWKARHGTPYVLDIQDPWLSDYYETHPASAPPPKYALARRVHAALEPWTLARADGLIAVSPAYLETLARRYARAGVVPSVTLPFGASPHDFDLLERHPQANRHFTPRDGYLHGVYAGRGGDDLATALDILFRAFRAGLASDPALFDRVVLHFVGTDYAGADRARKTVEPLAARAGLADRVHEDTGRVPYFEALQLMKDADFLLSIGSDDAAYTASKIYPCILARKPLLAVVHEGSTITGVLRETGAGEAVTFPSTAGETERAAAAARLAGQWRDILASPRPPDVDWRRFERYSAREMTRRQGALFDDVIERGKARAA
ncbi:MAG TPA: glycosyltransferase [Vicinamibacterales bacterium]|nr:glycosyltransferase [Vicinamibacterales bacterium]